MLVRCAACAHSMPYREGMAFCTACAAPLPALTPCPGCRRATFEGDRFCVFCAAVLPAAARVLAAGGELPGTPQDASVGDVQELLALAADARARAAATGAAPPPVTKRHLDQDDIDSLFGTAGS